MISYAQLSNLEPLSKLTNLQVINLHDCQISDLEPIKKLLNLETLDLRDCNIVDEQVEDLQKALPELEIVR